jgi:hypothetical protein
MDDSTEPTIPLFSRVRARRVTDPKAIGVLVSREYVYAPGRIERRVPMHIVLWPNGIRTRHSSDSLEIVP